MQITLPDDPQIASQAVAHGFRTVEEYVRHLVQADVGSHKEPKQREDEEFYAGWQDRFDELLSSLKPGNPHVDDSRESIYLDR
jgi:hypothetical protein